MRDVIPDIDRWLEAGKPVVLATVVETWGSAPRRVGAKMAFTPDGEITGSVSGGCVEGAVIESGLEVAQTGRPRLLRFGVADDTAWEVGLACGGTIEVFVDVLNVELFSRLRSALQDEQPVATVTVIQGPEQVVGREVACFGDGDWSGSLPESLADEALAAARAALQRGKSRRVTLGAGAGQGAAEAWEGDSVEAFVEALLPAPTLVIVGGVHIAVALAMLAKTLGYRTIVIDPRKAFGSAARFPHVDRLIQAWPQEALAEVPLNSATAVATLTHDPKIDDPALKIVLDSPAFYVGALGSRKTQARRRRRLLEAGLSEAQIDRLRGPIGLEIGAETPEEIALAVMAEVVAARRGA